MVRCRSKWTMATGKGVNPKENIDFSLEGVNVILIDDVLFTGRSIRSALDALVSFGRPSSVELLVLIDRRFSRELPIQPKYIGKSVDVIENEYVVVNLDQKHRDVVLLNDKKIGGILVETEIKKKNVKTIIGIGINLNISKKESWWGDLSKFALESKRNELINLILTEFLNIFDNSYDNWLDDWKKSCMHINKEIEIFDGEHLQKKAIFKDIDAQGNAIIESKEGEEVIATGQISIKGVY